MRLGFSVVSALFRGTTAVHGGRFNSSVGSFCSLPVLRALQRLRFPDASGLAVDPEGSRASATAVVSAEREMVGEGEGKGDR